MTAPAAALIQRPAPSRGPMREAAQFAHQAHPAAQTSSISGGFAAHLERRSPPPQARQLHDTPSAANETQAIKSALVRTAAPDPVPVGEPATEATTGKPLPDTRQIPAHIAAQAVQTLLGVRAATKADAAPAETDAPDAEPETAATPETAGPMPAIVPSILLAAPAPAPAPRAAAPLTTPPKPQTANAARIGAAPQRTVAPQTATDAPAAAPGSTPSGPAPALAPPAPALLFMLEPDAAAPGSPDPAAANPAAADAQVAPRAEPSTLAALTGAPAPGRAALRKGRSETEAALPGTNAPTETALSSSALAQPTASLVAGSGDPAAPTPATTTDQPAERIGFDALVDSIARARDGAADGAPVSVAMRHAEFGQVSMRFHTDADGLSVAMTSPDPGFAPAVAAAHAAEAAASTEAPPRSQQPGTAANSGSDLSGSQTQSGARSGAGQRQDGPPQQQRSATESVPITPRRGDAPADDGRGGIFA